jgi:hypothetical protein
MKRHIVRLSRIAIGILAMRFIDMYWLIFPAFSEEHIPFHWLSFVAPIAIGGIWMWLFVAQLKTQPLLPLHDPRFHDGISSQAH